MTDDPSAPSSSSSLSSPSQLLDQSLVRVFGALETTLTDLTASSQNNTSAVQKFAQQVSDLVKLIKNRNTIDDKRHEVVIDILVKLTNSLEDLVMKEGAAVGATVDARNALLAAKASLEESAEIVKNVSGEVPVYDPDGLPRPLQVVWVWIGNFGWKNKAKLIGWVIAAGGTVGYAVHRIAPFWRELVESFR